VPYPVPSEYDPLFSSSDEEAVDPATSDLERVRSQFESASRPYLESPWSWLSWAVVLPGTALAHPAVLRSFGFQGVVLLWSLAILGGGVIELGTVFRQRPRRLRPSSPLATWVFRMQGNLSIVAFALSVLLVWQGLAWVLPGVWLLLVGHSFYLLGGLAFRPFRLYGLAFQTAGLWALWPGGSPLSIFAGVTAAANLWMAYRVWALRRHGF